MENKIEKAVRDFFREVDDVSPFDFPQYQKIYGDPLTQLINEVIKVSVEETIEKFLTIRRDYE